MPITSANPIPEFRPFESCRDAGDQDSNWPVLDRRTTTAVEPFLERVILLFGQTRQTIWRKPWC
jgi:hypothetical protein